MGIKKWFIPAFQIWINDLVINELIRDPANEGLILFSDMNRISNENESETFNSGIKTLAYETVIKLSPIFGNLVFLGYDHDKDWPMNFRRSPRVVGVTIAGRSLVESNQPEMKRSHRPVADPIPQITERTNS